MTAVEKSKGSVRPSDSEQVLDTDIDVIPSKEEILEELRDGYVYVKSGGVGQPIDDVHREIAEALAREELAENVDIRL